MERRLRGAARALGEARDADVQIAYLEEYLGQARAGGSVKVRESLPAEITRAMFPVPVRPGLDRLSAIVRRVRYSYRGTLDRIRGYLNKGRKTMASPSAPGSDAFQPRDGHNPVPGIEYLQLRWRQGRDLLQEGIESAIADLEREGILGKIEENLKLMAGGGAGFSPTHEEALTTAFVAISMRIDALLSYGDALADPNRVREHHAMRIATKRLRYTLEAWRDLHRGAFADEIDTLKRLQDLLGELHDCDVWIGSIPGFILEEEERSRAFFGDDRHFRDLMPGIRAVLEDRRQRRVQLHEICLTHWRDLSFRRYWEGLREKALRPLIPATPGGMYRIGLLSDIHGDMDALAMAIADGRARGADLFLNAGDTLGEGQGSGRAVEMIRRKGVVSVIGNFDRELMRERVPARKRGPGEIVPPAAGIKKDSRRYMESLPVSIRLSVAGKGILLTHGSPLSRNEYLDERTPYERLCEIARESGSSAIVTGHSHLPSIRSVCGTLFVNPGSVGKPRDGNPLPCYAILEIARDGTMTASHHRIEEWGQNR